MKTRFLLLVAGMVITLSPLLYAGDIMDGDIVIDPNDKNMMTLYAGYPLCSDIVKRLHAETQECFSDWQSRENPVCDFVDYLNEHKAGRSHLGRISMDIKLGIQWEEYLKSALSDEEARNPKWADGYVSGNTKVLRMKVAIENFQDPIVLSDSSVICYWHNAYYIGSIDPVSAIVETVEVQELIPRFLGSNLSGQYVLSSLAYLFPEEDFGKDLYYNRDCWAEVESVDVKKRGKDHAHARLYSFAINHEDYSLRPMLPLIGLQSVRAFTVFKRSGGTWDDIDMAWTRLDDTDPARVLVFYNSLKRSYTERLVDLDLVMHPNYEGKRVYHLNIPETYAFYAGQNEGFKVLVATGFNEKVPVKDELVSTPDGSEMIP